ncbi:hypothetical protein C1D09_028170, partial [Mesorhizobium intechi]
VVAQDDGANRDPMPWPHRPMRHGPEGFGPEGFGPQHFGAQHMGPPPEFMLAARLSALETKVGVRAEQLDAWRDYTSALQAMLAPPKPDHGPGGTGGRGPNAENPSNSERDPFAFQEKLADDVTQRAVAAGKLKEAIAALRAKLTPEQLEILASAERPHGPPLGPWGNPPDDAAGPGGLPGYDRQLPPPRNGEQL